MLVEFLFIWLITALGLALVTFLVSGVLARSTGTLLMAALVLGIINAIIRPILWILTLPLTVLTYGLFALLINTLMVKITAAVVPGFEVDSFDNALLAIVGFIFLQWFMMDSVFWIHMKSTYPQTVIL